VIRGHTDWVELLLRTPGVNPEIIRYLPFKAVLITFFLVI
jgi:hypothetical protein